MTALAALNKGGVAVVIVNGDMFEQTTDDALKWGVHRPAPVIRPADAELDALAQVLNEAKTVTLAEALDAPVVHSSRAREYIEPNNPYSAGMTGILGNCAGVETIDHADIMLCLGTES